MSKRKPKWLENAVFYEIYPQSFNDTNADGIGDMKGILEKLDYIKELGCNAIWINPCFDSPFKDAGYDVRDYKKVAPRYGTNEDLKDVFDAVHERGMHVLIDLVPCHTSIEHEWFIKSMEAERNEFTDRYIWTDDAFSSVEGAYTLSGLSDRNGVALVSYFSCQPALNYGFLKPEGTWEQGMDDPGPVATREAMIDVMRFWLKMGCDGFRVDMAPFAVKLDDENRTGNIRLWQIVDDFLEKEYPDAAMVSEWGTPSQSLQGAFTMDFQLTWGGSHYEDLWRCKEPYFSSRAKGSIKDYVAAYEETMKSVGEKGYISIITGNHDIERMAYFLKGNELKMAYAFLLAMPGVPFIYYGDEIGMNFIEGLTSKEGGYKRTGTRTPMQWDNGLNDGFSTAAPEKLYLPLDKSEGRPTVEDQMNDENSLWREVQRLLKLRNENVALQGKAPVEFIGTDYPLVFRRKCDEQSILVIINPTDKQVSVDKVSGKVLHVCGNAKVEGGKAVVEAGTALFVEE